MLLALRRTASDSASWSARLTCALIRFRLVSMFCHGGIVVQNTLYHATSEQGLVCSEFEPEKWDLYDLGDSQDARILELFGKLKGAKYDWFSLLAFMLPFRVSDGSRLYCFEWCWYCITGANPVTRVTPEMLINQAVLNGTISHL